jgi:pyruvate,orthophosphate dikinase
LAFVGSSLTRLKFQLFSLYVLPGFTLTTTLCPIYSKENDLPAEVWKGVRENVRRIEIDMEKEFGSTENPLLFSCRSGAASK